MPSRTVMHLAGAIRDATGVDASPGAVAVIDGRIVAAGVPETVLAVLGGRADSVVDHGEVLITPAFVNAHAHLDLAAVGPRPLDGSFVDWIDMVIRERARGQVTAAVELGLAASHAAGVGWIGDVAATDEAVDARARCPTQIPGVAWLEVFGLGSREAAGATSAAARLAALRTRHADLIDLRIDLEPHAPYSAGRAVFETAARLGSPTTHLAETLDELRFVTTVDGPFRDLLSRVREWDDTIVPLGPSPIRALEPVLKTAAWVVAHCNYVDDDDLDALAGCTSISVAYCPVASEYFGHRGHRYREMLARGINVCLGTDSVICQPADEPQPHGILAQCRRLFARDATDPDVLLAMATIHGARALRLEAGAASLRPGAPARLSAIPYVPSVDTAPWQRALETDGVVRPI